jgi:phage baseplate assembly protein W
MASTIQTRYKDIDLSFTKNPKTKDIYTLTDIDAVKRSVKHLVLTKFSERLFHPEIGSAIYGSLFENITSETSIIIETSVQDVINNFEPRAKLIRVDVKETSDLNSIDVEIYFYIVNIQDPVSVRVNLERVR